MTRQLFGTDGIRGEANCYPMTPEIAVRVGQAAGQVLGKKSKHERPSVVIGKDTRLSGYMIEAGLQAGFTSAGFYTLLVGPMPTPAVAALTRSLRADIGVMISASHNPFQDNGIKLFGADGYKLSDSLELDIEELILNPDKIQLSKADKLGKAVRVDDAMGRYVEFLKQSLPREMGFDGLRVVVDCANGSAYKIAPKLLWELGAQVIRIGAEPDGLNINNNCGALHTKRLQKAVIEHGADIGIALDGDADRLILVDEKGKVLDGDQIMATMAMFLKEQGRLEGDTVVATQMSNLGLEKYLQQIHILMTAAEYSSIHIMQCIGMEMSGN